MYDRLLGMPLATPHTVYSQFIKLLVVVALQRLFYIESKLMLKT